MKYINLILLLIILAAVSCQSKDNILSGEEATANGDVDCDGLFTLQDAQYIAVYINTGIPPAGVKDIGRADMDGNGKINKVDLDLLLSRFDKNE